MSMLFDELSDEYLDSAGVLDILRGVPVPVAIDENGDMTTLSIALDMAKVIGGDPNYPYASQYLAYIDRITKGNTVAFLVSEGAKAADSERYEEACMFFRAALSKDPKSCDALYLYGRACKGAYETEDMPEDYVGNFKAESVEAFELLTVLHPEFAMGFYFLGYAYLNLGLYTKAKLTWDEFMKLPCPDDEVRSEVEERLEALNEPLIIEQACNRILSGDYMGGKQLLEPYRTGKYEKWWPLWYYLGIAESALGDSASAIADFKQALAYSPSNTEVMKELVDIYGSIGDETNADKYRRKIEIVSE